MFSPMLLDSAIDRYAGKTQMAFNWDEDAHPRETTAHDGKLPGQFAPKTGDRVQTKRGAVGTVKQLVDVKGTPRALVNFGSYEQFNDIDKLKAAEKPKPVPSPLASYPDKIEVGGRMVDRPPIYLSGKNSDAVKAAAKEMPNLGILVTPATSHYAGHVADYEFYGVDNGCYSGKGNFDEAKFYSLLERLKADGQAHKALFAVAPDEFDPVAGKGDWKATLERSAPHLPRIRAAGFPAAIVLQDGATADTVPWDDIDVLFVGGSTEFKTATDKNGGIDREFVKIVREAKKRNIPIHFGRVNSAERLELTHYGLNAASMDGTYLAFGPDKNLPKLQDWLKPWGKFPAKRSGDTGPAGLTKQEAIEKAAKGSKAKNLSHSQAVSATLAYLGTGAHEWSAVPVKDMHTTTDDKGRQTTLPVFDFAPGYKQVDTPFAGDDCCHLCGHNIKKAFHIQNHDKKWSMVVGSECVTKFGDGESGEKLAKKDMAVGRRKLVKQLEDARQELRAAGMKEVTHRNNFGNERIVKEWATHLPRGRKAQSLSEKVKEALSHGKGIVTARAHSSGHPYAGEHVDSDRIIANWHKAKAQTAAEVLAEVKEFLEEYKDKYALSEAQREAGNYPMTHKRIHGLAISIETPKGERRRPEWPPMAADYGYIKGTMGRDGDHVDVFLGPNLRSETVYVIDQSGATGKRFDEHKVMLGFYSKERAIATYRKCYKPGWRVGPVTTMTIAQFKNWLNEGDQMKPVHRQVSRYSSNLADLYLPYNPQPFIDRYQAQCAKERYEWNEAAHPRFAAGSPNGIGGQFRGSGQSAGGGSSAPVNVGNSPLGPDGFAVDAPEWAKNYLRRKQQSQPTAEESAAAEAPTPAGYINLREFLPGGGKGSKSFAQENAELAERGRKVASMPGLNKSSKIRDVASPPSIARDHDLHWSKAGEFSQKIFDWHLELNRAMKDITLEHTATADGADRDHKWEQAWQAGDKTRVRELLAQMNAMDKEARAKGINLASIVNANGLIPRELAERLAGGSRFFDPERLRDQIKAGNKKLGIDTIKADEKSKQDRVDKRLNYEPVPESAKIPGVMFSGNKSYNPKPLPSPRPQEPAPEQTAAAVGNRPGGSLSPRMLASAQQQVRMDTREPVPAPSSPEEMQSVVESAYAKLSKTGQRMLDNAIKTGLSDDGEELPSDMVADLRESVLDTWNQMRSQAEEWNTAHDQVLKGHYKNFGVGANTLRERLAGGKLQPDKIPGFDEMVEYARNHYPQLLNSQSSGESVGKGDDENALVQAIIKGRMDIPQQPWHSEVIEEARKRIGPTLAAAGNAPEFVQDPDDPEYVPFSLSSIVDEVMRYMAAEDFRFSA